MNVRELETSSGSWVVKRATSAEESARLQHEAVVLRLAAHPGVVELGGVEVEAGGMAALSTRHAGGNDLSGTAGLDVAEIGGLGAAVATIIADLHDVGLSHGAICAEHVVVGADGRPLLCSLGHAGSTTDVDPAADVAALRRLLRERLPPAAPKRLVRLLREPSGRSKRQSARALAASLARIVPDARLPIASAQTSTPPGYESSRLHASLGDTMQAHPTGGVAESDGPPKGRLTAGGPARPSTPPGAPDAPLQSLTGSPAQDRPWHDRRTVIAIATVAALIVAVVCVVALGAFGRLTAPHHRASVPAGFSPCPVADEGCRPLPATDGQFSTPSGRFVIDMPSAVVVIGRWQCRSPSLPAALDPRTGRVWVWDRWPGTTTVEARSLARIPGATSIAVVPAASGCDGLEVVRTGGRPVVVHPLEAGKS
jgi:hypothetical protein